MILQDFVSFLGKITNPWVYMLLFLSAYLENVFPPIPGDMVVIFGAFLVGIGRLQWGRVFVVVTIGSLLGFMTIYYLGLKWGQRLRYRKHTLLKVERWFSKYGDSVLLANRFLSGTRSAISFFAGLSNIKAAKVALFAGISCGLWNILLIILGSEVVLNWRKLTHIIGIYDKVVFAVIAAALITYIGYRKFKG